MANQGQMQGPDSVDDLGGTISPGGLESTIGTSTGGMDMRNNRTDFEDLGEQLMEDHDIEVDSSGLDDPRTQQQIELLIAQQEANAERHEAERIEQEAKEAEMAEAHANDELYHWGTDTYQGQEVDVWIGPGGHTYYAEQGTSNVVGVEWADGATPDYVGEYLTDGDAYAYYKLPDGTEILVDDKGDMVGFVEDFPPDTFWHPGLEMEVYAIPQGSDGGYDTTIYNAETGEPIVISDSGDYTVYLSDEVLPDVYSTYAPYGADYYLVIDEEGNVIAQVDIPPEKVWGFLGIVEYYDDGTVAIDVGLGATEIDIIGPEGGFSITIDALGMSIPLKEFIPGFEDMGEFTFGFEYDEDGTRVVTSFDSGMLGSLDLAVDTNIDLVAFMDGDIDLRNISWSTSADADLKLGPAADVGVFLEIGKNEDGDFYVESLTHLEMKVGMLDIEGGQNFYAEIGTDHFELEAGQYGKISVLGFYVERDTQVAIVVADGTVTLSLSDMVGAGHNQLGGFQLMTDNQLVTDGTREGTTATTGVRGAVVDSDGEEQAGRGAYFELDGEEGTRVYQSDDKLDNGVTHDNYSSKSPTDDTPDAEAPDDGANFELDIPDGEPTSSGGRTIDKGSRDAFDSKVGDVTRGDASGETSVPTRTNERALDPDQPVRAGASVPTDGKTTERDLGLDENRDPVGPARAGSQTTERDLGLDENREPIGAAGGEGEEAASGAAGPKRNDRGFDPNRQLVDQANDDAEPAPPAPAPPQDEEKPKKPEIETKRDPDAPAPKPKGEPVDPTDLPPLMGRDGEPLPPDDGPSDGPVLAGPGYDPSTPRPPIETERVWDGPGDDDDDIFGKNPGPGSGSGGRPGDGPPVIHLTDDVTASVASPPPPPDDDVTAFKSVADSVSPRLRDRGGADGDPDGDIGDIADGERALPHKWLADSATPRARDRVDVDVDDDAGLPWKGVERDVAPIKSVSQTVAPRSRDRGVDDGDVGDMADGEAPLPHKSLASEVAPQPRDLVGDDSDHTTVPDTDIPADDITTMVTGETAGGGSDGLEVGRAPVRIDPSLADRLDPTVELEGDVAFEATAPREPFVPEGDFVVERLDTPADTDAVAAVETAIPAVSGPAQGTDAAVTAESVASPSPEPDPGGPAPEPVPGPRPEPEPDPGSPPMPDPEPAPVPDPVPDPEPLPEPIPEPDPIEYEPIPEPEPEAFVDDAFDDGFDDDLDN